MKVTILPENITPFIPLLTKILPSHSQIPILSNLLLEAAKDGFFIRSTDLEMGVEVKIAAKIEEEGAITVPGKEFLETVAIIPKDKITLHTDKDLLLLTCRGNKISFNTISKDEFPKLYKDKGVEVDRFSKAEFVNIFSCLTFSVSNEETRPQLGGVFADEKQGYTNFVSTDGYRMSIKKITQKNKKKEHENIIVPVRLITEVIGLKEDSEIILYINKTENQILFEVGDALVVGRMIEGAFPDYEKVLPQNFATTVTFSRDDLLQNVKLSSVFAKENSNIAQLEVVGDIIKITTRTQGVGEGETVVECVKEGEDNKIAFNIRYLLDLLKNLTAKELVLKLDSSMRPAVFETPEKDFIHVIMPIQVD